MPIRALHRSSQGIPAAQMLQYNNRWDRLVMSTAAELRADMNPQVWD
jgi:hypothetical protein